ncbi:hypothetical protein M0802_005028 [Mischocyttarus mexicanus]|nr:hypothetical protein M0802_005028 [Mischocyttarus mexicanus]
MFLMLRYCVIHVNIFIFSASYIKICKRHDPNINECITDSINQLREKLAEGIPELDVPQIDPFTLNEIRLLRGPNAARLDINLTNFQVQGPSKFVIRDMKANTDDVSFTFKVSFPILNFKGKYQIDAKLLLLQLSGEGDVIGNFTNYDSSVILKANKIRRGNNEYLNFERMKIKIIIGDAKILLTNLFNGDPILGKVSNEIINNNNVLLIEEIKPELEKSLAEVLTKAANKVVETFTYDELFPEN